ncbi:MAG: RNA polymerase sigma factor [Vicinamibacterales bacterium]
MHADATGRLSVEENDDRALVSACLGGDKGAFDVLVERHRKPVYQVCYRFAGNHEDAAELTQDVFVRAYRALGTFKGQSALGTWLYRIAVNVGLNRAAVRQPPIEAIDTREHADPGAELPESAVLRSERAARVRTAIAKLPKKQRATLILRVYHELPHDQIAAILGSSAGAVKTNFFHALARLRKLLQEEEQ